jgi:hypothetical protein
MRALRSHLSNSISNPTASMYSRTVMWLKTAGIWALLSALALIGCTAKRSTSPPSTKTSAAPAAGSPGGTTAPSVPPCATSAFYAPSPHTALLGYRCSHKYAAAETASAMDGILYNGRGQVDTHIYILRRGAWVDTVSSGGGVYIPTRNIEALGLDAHEIATSLRLTISSSTAEQTLNLGNLGCNWQKSVKPCIKT